MRVHVPVVALSLVGLVAVLLAAPPADAGELPRAEPAAVGLSAEQLAKIDAEVEKRIASKAIKGAVTVVARRGKVAYLRAFGSFEEDTIVRIYSMTKPVTVVAALILVDEGKLALDDPVSKHLPAFANLRVQGREAPPPPMTVRHLMQHTSGFTYGFFGNTAVDKRYRKEGLLRRDGSLETMAAKLAKIPLLSAPGETWRYSVSIDLLARIVEVVSKKTFDVFLEERIFRPLGMADTGFFVPAEKAARLAPNYGPRGFVIDAPAKSPYLRKPGLFSGGGGLVSTAKDFTIFALMLANGGAWQGTRILKPETVKAMTTNQLPERLVPIAFGPLKMSGMGFGLGVGVRVTGAGPHARLGDWGWSGAASTTFFVSPEEDLVVVNMLQRMPMYTSLDTAIRPLIYAAIDPP